MLLESEVFFRFLTHACFLCALSSTNNENSNTITDDTIESSMKKVPHFEIGGISNLQSYAAKKGGKISLL